MKNTEFEAMNIEELELVTGGFSFDDVKDFIIKKANNTKDKVVKFGADMKDAFDCTVKMGEKVVNEVKSWFN